MHFPVYPCPFISDFQLCGFCQGLVTIITAVHRPEQPFRQFPKCKGSLPTRENNPQPPVPKVNVSSWVTDWEPVLQHRHAESAHPSAALTTAPGLEHLQSLRSKSVPSGSMPGQLLCRQVAHPENLYPGGLLLVMPECAPNSSNEQQGQCRIEDWRAHFLCDEAMTSQRSGNRDSNCSLKKERSCDYCMWAPHPDRDAWVWFTIEALGCHHKIVYD